MNIKKDIKYWVYDIETLKSCFTYTAYNIITEEIVQYVIHKELNQLNDLIDHLKKCRAHIGFNNISFDYPVIHFILDKYEMYRSLEISTEMIISNIYDESQRIISELNLNNSLNIVIPNKNTHIRQIDLFKMWHFNNKARTTSLKGLQVFMNYPNVMDMPIHHSTENITLEQINEVLKYNLNDVMSTYEFYKQSLGKIELRNGIRSKYNIDCINYSDSRIGEELVLKLYCDKTNKNPYDIKKLRSERSQINLKECIFPYIHFESEQFNDLLNQYNKTITSTKGAIEESVIFKGFKYDYGLGKHICPLIQ